MLNKFILKAINDVNSVKDFDALLSKIKLSDADVETKKEAINTLKSKKSVFDREPNLISEKVYQDIKAGAADIDDIGN